MIGVYHESVFFHDSQLKDPTVKYIPLLFVLALFTACSPRQQEQQAEPAGTAGGSVATELIGADNGYIVEHAAIASGSEEPTFSIKGAVGLKEAASDVMIIRTQGLEGKATEMLVLQFPAFAEGTVVNYTSGSPVSAFWIFGTAAGKKEVMKRTGAIEGTLRLVKQHPATNNMGLNRELFFGSGEMEIVVTGIENDGLDVPVEKKYAARYRLPMITLDEFARINQPI